jgi:hypothetical protein
MPADNAEVVARCKVRTAAIRPTAAATDVGSSEFLFDTFLKHQSNGSRDRWKIIMSFDFVNFASCTATKANKEDV